MLSVINRAYYLSNDGTLEMKCCQPSCDDNGRQVRDGSDRRKKCKSMAEAQKQLLVDFFFEMVHLEAQRLSSRANLREITVGCLRRKVISDDGKTQERKGGNQKGLPET
jgi:hypothetical protein